MARFKRILLKLSGESLAAGGFGIDVQRLQEYAQQIKEVHDMGVQIGIVIGGGNIFRGLSGASKGFDRVKGDQMGMMATVINSLALSSALGAIGVKNKVLTAIRMEPVGEFYSKWKAIDAMEDGGKDVSVVIKKPKTFSKITKFFAIRFNLLGYIQNSVISKLNDRVRRYREGIKLNYENGGCISKWAVLKMQ